MGGGGDMNSPFENIKSKLKNFRKVPLKEGYTDNGRASCPCCGKNGKDQKLSVAENDGDAFVHCYSGCSAADVLAAVGLDLSNLYQQRPQNAHAAKSRGVKGWDWWSLAGALEVHAYFANNAFFELTRLLPKNDDVRLIVAKLAGDQKEFARALKFGRNVK